MTTVLNLYPYDPGSEEAHRKLHGCKSYIFWPPVHDTISEDRDKKSAIVENGKNALLALGPRSVASVYLIVQLVLHYFLQWLRRVAVTVKIIYPSNELLGDRQQSQQQVSASKSDHSTTKDKDLSLITSTTSTSSRGVDAAAAAAAAAATLIDKQHLLLVRSNLNDLKIDRSAVRELRFDFAGYFEKFHIDKFCLSTKFSTAIFEVSNGGLQHLIKDLKNEFRSYCPDFTSVTGSGSILACCDVTWSIPSKYRSYWTELFLTNEIDNVMRINNQRVYDVLFADDYGLSRASKGGIVQRTETTDKTVDASIGVYRHFYPELLKLAHEQAAKEHEYVWNFDPELSDVKMDWPMSNDLSKTTVVAVNLIVLNF